MRRVVLWVAGGVGALSLAAGGAWSQTPQPFNVAQARAVPPTAAASGEASIVARTNAWTVTIAGGQLEDTFMRFAAELARALDDGDELRVLPIVTYGAAENLNDLLYLKGIDIAITHTDVFHEFKRKKRAANLEQRVNYISQMYVGELHVFARHDIKTIYDLEGQTVGFDTKGAGPTVTGPILFERLGIKVKPVFINNSAALEKMKTGEIAAILHTVGKPNNLFTNVSSDVGHFLPVEYSEKFSDYYVPSVLTHEDYPTLIKEGEKIETIGIPVVLAVYNWPEGHDRHRRVERFIQYYFERFDTLRKPPFHPKWKEINLAAKVPGWARYPVAERMLEQMQPQAVAAAAPGIDPAYARTQAARVVPNNRAEQERLFQEFLEWSRRRAQRQGR